MSSKLGHFVAVVNGAIWIVSCPQSWIKGNYLTREIELDSYENVNAIALHLSSCKTADAAENLFFAKLIHGLVEASYVTQDVMEVFRG